jgi:hypothetical protein
MREPASYSQPIARRTPIGFLPRRISVLFSRQTGSADAYPHRIKPVSPLLLARRISVLEVVYDDRGFLDGAPKSPFASSHPCGRCNRRHVRPDLRFLHFWPGCARGIAGGLLGRQAVLQGGTGIWILGVLLHYFIAISAATIYSLASRKLEFLRDHWLVCGIFYGIAIFLVMNLVVLPLCAYHFTGPYQYRNLLEGLLVHIFIIGAPISLSLRTLSS